jgi:hypothetical protein
MGDWFAGGVDSGHLHNGYRHIWSRQVGYSLPIAEDTKEVVVTRNVMYGAIVIIVLIAAYFLLRGNETPQSIPTGTTEQKK